MRSYFFPLSGKKYDREGRWGASLLGVALISGMRKEVRPHGEMASLAAAQHGVVSHAQLIDLGYSTGAIARALEARRLHRLHRGAYALGHTKVSRHGLCLAAVLSCGGEAVVSHESAAWLWGLSARWPNPPHVTTPIRGHSRRTIRLHHSTILEEEDRTILERVPTTAVARTFLDLSISSQRRVESMLERAERLGLLDIGAIDFLIARSGRHPGRKRLLVATAIYRDPAMTRARTERLFIALVRRAGLPRPAINYFIAGHEIDAYWERERFAVELDGYETHGTRAAFERDPIRIEELKLAGIDAIRFTARRIEREPDQVATRLRSLLTQRRQALHA
jgi:very-short-patch-repair endonuclease